MNNKEKYFGFMKHLLLRSLLMVSMACLQVNAQETRLNAQEHVVQFQKGVDAFMLSDYDKCDDYWLPLARAGDPMAARNMGLLFQHGLGVRQDYEEAALYYQMAAEAGVTSAQLALGLLYLQGTHLPQDLTKSKELLQTASDAGNASALYNLGLIYEYGLGIPSNKEHAFNLYNQAAKAGHERAILKLGSNISSDMQEQKTVSRMAQTQTVPENAQNKNQTPNILPKSVGVPETYQQQENTHRPDQIAMNPALQSNTPDFMLRDKQKYQPYQVQTPMEKNPFDITTRDKATQNGSKTEIFSHNETAQDRGMIEIIDLWEQKKYDEAIPRLQKLFSEDSGEAAYFLGEASQKGLAIAKDTFKTYYYWKKGADDGSQKCINALETLRSKLSKTQLLEFERATMDE